MAIAVLATVFGPLVEISLILIAMSPDVAGFFERTACRHLEKPIAPDDLLKFVDLICEQDVDGPT